MGTAIVFVVLFIILIPAIKSACRHMKGQGSCCGGGSSKEKVKKQQLKVNKM